MEIHHADALILDVFDLHDKDRLVTFLTRERGKKKGVARSARTKHSRFAGMLQPLSRVRMSWVQKEGRDLVRIQGAELQRSAAPLQKDLEGILLGAYLAEHMVEFVQEDEPGELPFRLLDSTLEALVAGVDPDLAARYFETWVLRLAGIFPSPTACPRCGQPYPDAEAAAYLPADAEALLCPDCVPSEAPSADAWDAGTSEAGTGQGTLRLSPEAVRLLWQIDHTRLAALAEQAPGPAALRQVEEACRRIRRAFLQKELKSARVMRETLGR